MDKLFILFLIMAPLVMFFCGFLIARQVRPLENALLISKLFVQGKLLLSIVTGFFISVFFTFLYSTASGFTLTKIIAFIVLFTLVSGAYYFGMKIGWGNSSGISQNSPLLNNEEAEKLPGNIAVENTFNSIKITINANKRWWLFGMSLFQLVIIGFCALPIFGLMMFSLLQEYIPESLRFVIGIAIGGLILYLIYIKFQEALGFIFDKEIIEIDNQAVRIDRSGSGFTSRKNYSADNVKKITNMFYFAGANMKRSPFTNSNMPTFMVWHNHGLKKYRTFGRGIDLVDAQRILETIYSRFPQYKG